MFRASFSLTFSICTQPAVSCSVRPLASPSPSLLTFSIWTQPAALSRESSLVICLMARSACMTSPASVRADHSRGSQASACHRRHTRDTCPGGGVLGTKFVFFWMFYIKTGEATHRVPEREHHNRCCWMSWTFSQDFHWKQNFSHVDVIIKKTACLNFWKSTEQYSVNFMLKRRGTYNVTNTIVTLLGLLFFFSINKQ